jgi:L-ascorbate metabolism protein UlaG (beta-lactamase superfamily)
MIITKYTHSCVRVEVDGAVLVVDPGTWSEAYPLKGCDAVLVTHEHTDHVDTLRLAGLGVPVYAPVDSDIPDVEVTEISPGESFSAAGIAIQAVGGQHAAVIDGQVTCPNLGYIIGDQLYHPGDALIAQADRSKPCSCRCKPPGSRLPRQSTSSK